MKLEIDDFLIILCGSFIGIGMIFTIYFATEAVHGHFIKQTVKAECLK